MAFSISKAFVFLFLLAMTGAAMNATSILAVIYDVGDYSGWTFHVDDDGYKSWTTSKIFHVGDILRFKYDPQYHNVMQVIYPDYISCNTTRPLATYTTGNDFITIKKGGHSYFICGVPGHCGGGGMKLHIHVSPMEPAPAAPTIAPTPSLGATTPAPTPYDHHHKNGDAVVHNVGGFSGWTTIGHVDYKKWAASKTFHVGDILNFKYHTEYHNVMQVTYPDYVSCNATRPLATYTTGDDYITIKKGAHYYFICGVPGHCQNGLKLNIHPSPRAR
ncbi:Plastocyanin-like [Macleaya cordata]|uniref:Plastocyanin-like n=1 Tax=Macleaya cordata TaxID=56857 RepID=A0A200Q558_MACCD|nr:Plastocyanin-like [Macleaya cordata]